MRAELTGRVIQAVQRDGVQREVGEPRQEDLLEVLEEGIGAFADRIDLRSRQAEDRAVFMFEGESAGGRSPDDRYATFRPRAQPFQVAAGGGAGGGGRGGGGAGGGARGPGGGFPPPTPSGGGTGVFIAPSRGS